MGRKRRSDYSARRAIMGRGHVVHASRMSYTFGGDMGLTLCGKGLVSGGEFGDVFLKAGRVTCKSCLKRMC